MMTTKKKYIQHNKECFACGQEKAPSFLGYDIKTLKTYCLNKCKNKQHIPAVQLIPATNEALISGIEGNYSQEDEDAIMGLLGKVASTRMRPAHILHVMKIAEMEGLPSIQATLLNIIEADMAARSMDDVELESFGQEREPEEEDEMVKDRTVEPNLQHFAPPEAPDYDPSDFVRSKEEINAIIQADAEALKELQNRREHLKGEQWNAVKAVINEKPVEPVKEVEEEDDNPFEI
jgi:hypothetical protein